MTSTSLELPPTQHAPGTARQGLKALLEQQAVPVDVMGRLLLITSELVTSALSWPAAAGDRPLRLSLDVDERRARIAVFDPRPRGRGGEGRFPRHNEGVSFVILDRLSDRWGVVRGGQHSEAWSEVDLHS